VKRGILLDPVSRMKAASWGFVGEAAGRLSDYQGVACHFCSDDRK